MTTPPLRVLLVEDSPTDAKLVTAELRRCGRPLEIERVDSAEAMRAALRGRTWDLVISDWSLPSFSGTGALEVLHEANLDLPFIIVSGTVGEGAGVAAMRAGAHDYVLKDQLARLVPAIERELREHARRVAHREAEAQLRLQDAKFRALLERSTDIIVLTTADSRYAYVSPAIEKVLGWSPQELVGMPCVTLVDPADHELAITVHDRLLATPGESVSVTYRARHHDGSLRWIEATQTNLLDDPAVHAIVANLRDITDRKLAVEQLEASEQRFRQIITTTNEGVWVIGRDGRTTFVNPRMQDILGYTFDELAAVHAAELFPPNFRESVRHRLEDAGGGTGGFAETTLRHKDGTYRYVAIEASPMLDDKGALEGYLAMVSDLSARRAAELALRASETRFARLLESGIVGVGVIDREGAVIEVNDALLHMTGYSRDDLGGKVSWRELTPVEWRARDEMARRDLIERGVAAPLEREIFRKDGTRLPVLVGVAMLDDQHLIMFLIDLTAQKGLERALARSEQQLLQAQKMEAMGRLAGGVAHDFNNVLSVILSYAEMLLENAQGPARDDLSEITRAANRAAELTRQLLVFSRQQVISPTVVDPVITVNTMKRMLQRVVGEDVELAIVDGDDVGRVRIDPGQLEQVVMNLVINARDAMPQGGSISVELARVVLDEVFAERHLGVTAGPHVMIAVSDSGTGMDRETAARVFEPFFTTKPKGKGTGLGLSTVFGIVQNAGGTVWVYTEPGIGTTFKIYLPRVTGAVEKTGERPAVQPVGGRERILLVEDEPQVRQVIGDILGRFGYEVLVAASVENALEIASQVTAIDLLLSDVVMPRMSGPELARAICALQPEIAVIHMSGYTDDAVVRHGIISRDVPFLQKPITRDVLLRKVREVLDGRRGVSQAQ